MAENDEIPQQQRPFATVMLNGCQIITCPLPDEGTTTTEADITGELMEVLCETGMQLVTTILSPNIIPKDNTLWRGTLLLDGTHCIELGSVVTRRQNVVRSEYLPTCPMSVQFSMHNEKIDPTMRTTTDSEEQLITLVKKILEDPELNPRRGALPSRSVESKAKEHSVYFDVIGNTESDWVTFIRRHNQIFNLFQYSEQEIRDRQMEGVNLIDELRIVLLSTERVQLSEQEDEVDEELVEFLKELLSERDMSYHEVLAAISEKEKFVFTLAPAFSLLMRFLNRHRDLFCWTTDPAAPTRVSLADPSVSRERKKARKPRNQKKNNNGMDSCIAPPHMQHGSRTHHHHHHHHQHHHHHHHHHQFQQMPPQMPYCGY